MYIDINQTPIPCPKVQKDTCEDIDGIASNEPHTCPYAEAIYDDYESTCSCCLECVKGCQMNV